PRRPGDVHWHLYPPDLVRRHPLGDRLRPRPVLAVPESGNDGLPPPLRAGQVGELVVQVYQGAQGDLVPPPRRLGRVSWPPLVVLDDLLPHRPLEPAERHSAGKWRLFGRE